MLALNLKASNSFLENGLPWPEGGEWGGGEGGSLGVFASALFLWSALPFFNILQKFEYFKLF